MPPLDAQTIIALAEEYKGGVKPKFSFEDVRELVSYIRDIEGQVNYWQDRYYELRC